DFIATGFNDRANHRMLLRELEETLPLAARHGVPNVIAMFGNRRGKSDAEAIDNCVAGLNQIKAQAEARRVTICLELLNSKIDHPDYQGDRTAFGVAVVKAVGSPRVRLLYDIYHMQIMEGDIIRTIRDNREWLAHFHTGGVPGRHELDGTQELNWHAVAAAIADVVVLEAGEPWDNAKDSAMLTWPYESPRRGKSTKERPFGEFDACIGGWELPGEPYTRAPGTDFAWWRARMVGGRTNHWGRISLRFGPYDFTRKSRDGLGDDWPISYDDVAPYYDRLDRLVGIFGSKENLPNEPNGVFLPPPRPRCHELLVKQAADRLRVTCIPARL